MCDSIWEQCSHPVDKFNNCLWKSTRFLHRVFFLVLNQTYLIKKLKCMNSVQRVYRVSKNKVYNHSRKFRQDCLHYSAVEKIHHHASEGKSHKNWFRVFTTGKIIWPHVFWHHFQYLTFLIVCLILCLALCTAPCPVICISIATL